jgi:hypothetical protein
MTSAIIQLLVSNAGVQAVAGLNKAGTKYKVFAVVADQEEIVPYITVYKAQNNPEVSTSKDEISDLDYPRVVVSCFSTNFRESELMFEAVRIALDNKSAIQSGYILQRIWLVDDRDGWDKDASLFTHQATFAVEQKRAPSSIYEYLATNGFVLWGGLWNWGDHSNNLPSVGDVQAGKIWITEDDRGVPGDDNYYPAGTQMTATVDGVNTFDEFNFNLA